MIISNTEESVLDNGIQFWKQQLYSSAMYDVSDMLLLC